MTHIYLFTYLYAQDVIKDVTALVNSLHESYVVYFCFVCGICTQWRVYFGEAGNEHFSLFKLMFVFSGNNGVRLFKEINAAG